MEMIKNGSVDNTSYLLCSHLAENISNNFGLYSLLTHINICLHFFHVRRYSNLANVECCGSMNFRFGEIHEFHVLFSHCDFCEMTIMMHSIVVFCL